MLDKIVPDGDVNLMQYGGVEATRIIADCIDTNRVVALGNLMIAKIRAVELHNQDIIVSGILEDARPILFRYGIDDEPVIIPTIQLLGTK